MKKNLFVLSQKYTALVCILVALVCRTINILYVSHAGRDKMLLVLQSKSLLERRGLGVPQYFLNQLDSPVYDYTQLWPPGYPILIAPFLKIFNYNIYLATTSLDILIGISFILIVRKISAQIELPSAAVNLMTLIAGCFEYPFIGESQSTDLISMLFILFALSYLLKAIDSKSFLLRQIFFAGLLLFLPCFFRYAYPPISIAIPLVIVFGGWMMKNKLLITKGWSISAVTVVLIALLFLVLLNTTGKAGYITPTERGYFPVNIIHWYPVVPTSFIDLSFLSSQVIKIAGISLSIQEQLLEFINIFVLTFLTVLFFYGLCIKKSFRNISPFKWLILWGSICSVVIFLSLAWLSFTYQMQKTYLNTYWNYIYEARYYALVFLFVQLVFLGWVFLSNSWKKIRWQKIIITACFIFLFIEVTHSIYFYTKVAFNFKQYKSAIYKEQDYNYFNELLSNLEKEKPGYDILVAAPGDSFYIYTAAYYGKKGIFDGAGLKNMLPKVKTKSLLVMMLFDNELDVYKKFISAPNVQLIRHIAFSNFFTLEIYP